MEHKMWPIPKDAKDDKKPVEASGSDHLRLLQLTKSFASNVAVDNVSFGVSPDKVFSAWAKWRWEVDNHRHDSRRTAP
jgi:hypothetical protein